MELDKAIIDKMNAKGLQSVRNLVHLVEDKQVVYAIYIEKGFKNIGWMAEIDGKYYGSYSPLGKILKAQMDDIIDAYLAIDDQAKRSIEEICKKTN